MFSHTPLGPGVRGCFWVMCSVLSVTGSCFFAVRHCWRKFRSPIVFRGFIPYAICCFCAVPWILRPLGQSLGQGEHWSGSKCIIRAQRKSNSLVVIVLAVRKVEARWWSMYMIRQLESSHWIPVTNKDHCNLPLIPGLCERVAFGAKGVRKKFKRLKVELASKPNKAGMHKETEPKFKFI